MLIQINKQILRFLIILLAIAGITVFYQGCVQPLEPLGSAPAKPELFSPPSGATGLSTSPVLRWNSVKGALSYRLQVSTDNNFTNIIYDTSNITVTNKQVFGLSSNVTYFWRVNALSNAGNSGWSDFWSFKTGSPLVIPNPPTLLSPANGAVNQPTSITLSWSSVTGALTYLLQVSTDSNFTNIINNVSGLTSTSQLITSLANNTFYYWRVAVITDYASSNWSDYFYFKTIQDTGTVPGKPVLISPATGTTNVSITPTLSWNAVAGAVNYSLQVSLNETFTSLVVNQSGITTTSSTTTTLTILTKHYWRVRAHNAAGVSPWSDYFEFTTGSTGNTPTEPTLLSPANGSSNISTTPILTWNSVTNATSYTLQVSLNPTFTNLVYNQGNITSTSRQTPVLSSNTTHYWRVSAQNSFGSSAWSTTFSFTTGSISTVPVVPVLLSPANGATNQPTSVNLTWQASSGATSYIVQVSTTSTFASYVFNQSGIINTSQTITGLSNATVYYWRVNAVNMTGQSGWSEVWSFTTISGGGNVPEIPTLVSPPTGATELSTSPTLTWNSSTGATSYTLQVSLNTAFTSLVYNQSNLTATSQQVTGLNNGITYYWRVNASNSYGASGWSNYFIFTTSPGGTVPATPSLASPPYGATEQPLSPTLSWYASTYSSSYILQVSLNSNFSSFVYNQSGITTTSQQVTGLSPGTTYYWRVAAVNGYGQSGWSNYYAFTTTAGGGQAPQPPTPTSPPNAATNQNLNPTLSWSSVSNATSYGLQVATSNTFNNLVFSQTDITTTSKQVTGLNTSTTYFWRVNAKNNFGTSAWSDYFIFTTGSSSGLIPAIPNLLSPINGATGIPVTTQLQWNSVSGANSYGLQVSTSNTFINLIHNQTGITGTAQQVTGLQLNTTYYWRVNATNTNGTSGWSEIWSFTTGSGGAAPAVPTLLQPTAGSTNQPLNPTLSWSSVTGATSYGLQVSSDNNFSSFVFNQTGLTSTSQQISGLSGNTTYYWRVNASNSNGTSAWSQYWSFITVMGGGNVPPIPTLNSPPYGSTEQSVTPTLSWYASSGATSYILQVSLNTDFTSLVYNQSGITSLSQQVTGLSNGTTYYWRVAAVNSYGQSGWSNYNAFTTSSGGGVPYIPTLASPAYGATNVSTSPWLVWYVAAFASEYTLQVSLNSSFTSIIFNQSGIKGTAAQVSGLNGNTTYYWRVSAQNGYGSSGWSNYNSFTTGP